MLLRSEIHLEYLGGERGYTVLETVYPHEALRWIYGRVLLRTEIHLEYLGGERGYTVLE